MRELISAHIILSFPGQAQRSSMQRKSSCSRTFETWQGSSPVRCQKRGGRGHTSPAKASQHWRDWQVFYYTTLLMVVQPSAALTLLNYLHNLHEASTVRIPSEKRLWPTSSEKIKAAAARDLCQQQRS